MFALQPYSLLSPSPRSDTKTRSLELWLLSRSMEHEEKSVRVKQLFLMTCRVPNTKWSESLNMDSDNKSTSGFRSLPVHSISCRLGNPLKSRAISPEINIQSWLRYFICKATFLCFGYFLHRINQSIMMCDFCKDCLQIIYRMLDFVSSLQIPLGDSYKIFLQSHIPFFLALSCT